MNFFRKMSTSFQKVFSNFYDYDDCGCKRITKKGMILLAVIIVVLAIT